MSVQKPGVFYIFFRTEWWFKWLLWQKGDNFCDKINRML